MPAVSTGFKVLLTGGTGFLGAWILKTLLDDGFTVRAAVRSPAKTDFIKNRFSEHADKIEFVFIDDVTTPDIFDSAVEGVDAIIHSASPLSGSDPLLDPAKLIDPAVNGTIGILKSALKSSSVKRVVVTSSVTAVMELPPRHLPIAYTEDDWNESGPKIVEQKGKNAPPFIKYATSKTYAEQAAWDLVNKEKPHFDLVTILPSYIWGKILSETSADIKGSNTRLLSFLKASALESITPEAKQEELQSVDVRDVSKHHVLALTVPEAGGQRLISSAETVTKQAIVNLLNEHPVEGIKVPPSEPSQSGTSQVAFSNERIRKILGVTFRPYPETVRETLIGALEVGWTQ